MSERDFPPRGRQPSSELEEMLTQVQQYWQGFRGGPIVGLVAVVVALIFLWSSWFTAQPEETGVVQRFGAVVRIVGPGLHFKLPYGIETVQLVPTARVLKEEFGDGFELAAKQAGVQSPEALSETNGSSEVLS